MDDVSLFFVCLFHVIGFYLVVEYRLKPGLDSGLWTLDPGLYESPESRVYSPEPSPDFIFTCQTLIRFL